MKLLLDQDVYAATARFLIDAGHDVLRVAEIGLAQAADEELLETAHTQGRPLVTRDRDYGTLVFVRSLNGGVIYLRILPASLVAVHAELARVLSHYEEAALKTAFVVIEAGRHRYRKL